jgi:hypothetical protein
MRSMHSRNDVVSASKALSMALRVIASPSRSIRESLVRPMTPGYLKWQRRCNSSNKAELAHDSKFTINLGDGILPVRAALFLDAIYNVIRRLAFRWHRRLWSG